MKDLRTLLEASILDIENTLSKDINFELLLSASSIEQFNSYCNALKDVIEDSGNGPFNYKQLKKGKPYVFIFRDNWFGDSKIVAFVDKWPISDGNLLDDQFYIIEWDDSRRFKRPSCRFDNTGNEFSNLLEQDFGKDSMKDAYEVPDGLIQSMKNVIKIAKPFA
jgi:hypothetical protein